MDNSQPRPRYRVMKFGGSSVGSAESLVRVIDIIAARAADGPVAVVVSAMGDTTDYLLEAGQVAASGDIEGAERVVDRVADLAVSNVLAVSQQLANRGLVTGQAPEAVSLTREILGPLRQLLHGMSLVRERTRQTMDLVMSFGERLSARMVAELLTLRGVPGLCVDARDWTVTGDQFGQAMVDWEATCTKLGELSRRWNGHVPVNTGFLGRTPDGRTVTLGRNGSDYTATLLARGVEAREVIIWTDVSGVMTADPAIVKDAYPLARMSFMEALELANFGARMFHPRTMIPLIESGIPMRIQNTMAPDAPGTLIDAEGGRDITQPTSVSSLEGLALLDIQWRRLTDQPKVGERVLRALDQAGITVWMAIQAAHGQAVAVVVPEAQLERAEAAIGEELAWELERREVQPIGIQRPVTLLTLVAEAMGQGPNVAGRLFHALGAVGVQIYAIGQGASCRSVSCVVDAEATRVAVRTVHAAFNLAHQVVSLLVLGKGVVGSQLLAQLDAQREVLQREHDVQLNVVGIADSQRVVFDELGLDLANTQERLATGSDTAPSDSSERVAVLDKLRRLPVPVLVDCTAADGIEALYQEAWRRGVHVVAANKKPLSGSWHTYGELMDAARRSHRAYHYETTVGSSLPIIETLKNIVRTGDRVLLIEGSFSGSVGYITGELMRGVALSEVVRRAQELGYTEPEPQDDLAGLDVARKALILARELGVPLTLDDKEQVRLEPLVPKEVIGETDPTAFFAALRRYEGVAAERVASCRAEGKTLRYLARIDPSAVGQDSGRPVIEVGPVAVAADHPANRVRGAESFVAFTTERYKEYPLVVQGPGAGGAVTAAGVLADVLRVSTSLRGIRGSQSLRRGVAGSM